jgi:hypothetical protein
LIFASIVSTYPAALAFSGESPQVYFHSATSSS